MAHSCGVMASSSPEITSTGQRTRAASARASSVESAAAAWAVISTSGVVSRPHPTQSSIGLVEWGSVNMREKKNSRKPG